MCREQLTPAELQSCGKGTVSANQIHGPRGPSAEPVSLVWGVARSVNTKFPLFLISATRRQHPVGNKQNLGKSVGLVAGNPGVPRSRHNALRDELRDAIRLGFDPNQQLQSLLEKVLVFPFRTRDFPGNRAEGDRNAERDREAPMCVRERESKGVIEGCF